MIDDAVQNGTYTPNPVAAKERRANARLICVVTTDPIKLWHYAGCQHHVNEFLKATREVGDDMEYHVFRVVTGDMFCEVCYAIERGARSFGLHNQAAAEVNRVVALPTERPGVTM